MRFLKPALRLLSPLYTPAGGQVATDKIDLEGTIQLVHDTSREAEHAAIMTNPGAAGLYSLDQDNVHAVGGETVLASIDPYGTLDATWGIPDGRWAWLMRYAAGASSGPVMGVGADAVLSLQIPALGNALTRRDFMIDYWLNGDVIYIGTDLAATFPIALAHLVASKRVSSGMPLPIPLPPGCRLTWRTIATAATPGTIRIVMLCWIGPFGVYPPGMF